MRRKLSPSEKPTPEYADQSVVKPGQKYPLFLGSHEPGNKRSLNLRIYPLDIADFDVRVYRDQVDDETLWLQVHNRSKQEIYVVATVLGGSNADRSAS